MNTITDTRPVNCNGLRFWEDSFNRGEEVVVSQLNFPDEIWFRGWSNMDALSNVPRIVAVWRVKKK